MDQDQIQGTVVTHSPEPWCVDSDDESSMADSRIIRDANGEGVALEVDDADAVRIVACVNALVEFSIGRDSTAGVQLFPRPQKGE